jgi:hypothetical protein
MLQLGAKGKTREALFEEYLPKCSSLKRKGPRIVYVSEDVRMNDVLKVEIPPDVKVTETASGIELTQDGLTVLAGKDVLKEIVRRRPEHRRGFMRITPEQSFLAICDDTGSRFNMVSFDSRTGGLLWKAELWGLGTERFSIIFGSWFHDLEIMVGEDNVGLFGHGSKGCYLEVLDRKTGSPNTRFSTNYWCSE